MELFRRVVCVIENQYHLTKKKSSPKFILFYFFFRKTQTPQNTFFLVRRRIHEKNFVFHFCELLLKIPFYIFHHHIFIIHGIEEKWHISCLLDISSAALQTTTKNPTSYSVVDNSCWRKARVSSIRQE